jgi:cysteine desulfurase / selenocysteine lyase
MNHSPFTAVELNHLRRSFPHLENGLVYLNHAAISPLPLPVTDALHSFMEERQSGPIENFEHGIEITEETRNLVAGYLNAPSSRNISFLGNTSEAISAVAEGFPWQQGDEIILNDMEFPANVQPFRILQNRGVKLKIIKTANHRIEPEQIEDAITPSTRMVSISAVQFLSGFRANLEAIGEICSAHDIAFVTDAIQCLGAMPIDVQKCKIDALAGGSHKWLMSPLGLGFLYTSDKLASKLRPFKTGWLSVEEPMKMKQFEQPWKPFSSHLEAGAPNMLGITGLGASFKNMNGIGTDRITNHIHYLTSQLLNRLSGNKNVSVITPEDPEYRAGIVTFSIGEPGHADEVVKRLKESNIMISAREGYLRISPHYYNTVDEIEIALGKLL